MTETNHDSRISFLANPQGGDRLLAHLGGARPPAPDWFTDAVNLEPEPLFATREGRRIEYRIWGDGDAPPVLLLHGNLASCRWWSWIAPWLARQRRVVAMSFAGMGLSDPCEDGVYSPERFLGDIHAVAAASDLFDGPDKPMIVAHSASGGVALWAAAQTDCDWGGAVIIDSSVHYRHPVADPSAPPRSLPVFADIADALARFRLTPYQPCDHLFIADFIARAALKKVDGGWSWGFDPRLWDQFRPSDGWEMLPQAQCPLVFINGEKSLLTGSSMVEAVRRKAPRGTRFIEIPRAHHHMMIDNPVALTAALDAVLKTWSDGPANPSMATS